jgi:hypothetical protein
MGNHEDSFGVLRLTKVIVTLGIRMVGILVPMTTMYLRLDYTEHEQTTQIDRAFV